MLAADETHTGILTAILIVNVNHIRAVEETVTEIEIEIHMVATAGTGVNVAARPLRAADDIHRSTEGDEAIQEALPEVAAPQEAVQGITTLPLPLPRRTAGVMLPVGKVVLLDWPLLLSSMRMYTGSWHPWSTRICRRIKGKGKGKGQININQVMKSFRGDLPLQDQVSVSKFSFSTVKNPDWTPFGSKSNSSYQVTPLNCFVIVRTPTILIVFVSSIFIIVAGRSNESLDAFWLKQNCRHIM